MSRSGSDTSGGRRYLIPTEQREFVVRRHWWALAGRLGKFVVALSAAYIVLRVAGGTQVGQVVGGGLFLGAVVWIAWQVGDWWLERFTVTNRRVLLVSGLLTRKVAIMPLAKVTDLTYERSVTGRMLGFGSFVMESAGQDQALSRIDYLPDPDSLYLQISNLLFGAQHSSHDPDEDDPVRPVKPAPPQPPAAPTSGGGAGRGLAPGSGSGPGPGSWSARAPGARPLWPTLPPTVPRPGAAWHSTPTMSGSPGESPSESTGDPSDGSPDRSPEGATTDPLPDIARWPDTSRVPRGRQDPLG